MTKNKGKKPSANTPSRLKTYDTEKEGQLTQGTRRGEQYTNLIRKAVEEVLAKTRSRKMN